MAALEAARISKHYFYTYLLYVFVSPEPDYEDFQKGFLKLQVFIKFKSL